MSLSRTLTEFAFPPVAKGEPAPKWNGATFAIGAATRRVVAYDVGESGWSDDLTALHEHASEDGRHFIDIASREAAVEALKGLKAGSLVLEVGVSSGHFIDDLRKARPDLEIIGADYTLGTLQKAAERLGDVPLLQMDLTRASLPDACVDAIVILNVLEHIEDDSAAIRNCFRMLKPGGRLVVEVPAGPWLYDDYDRALMHFRRYTAGDLKRKLKAAGFTIRKFTHLGFFIYPPFAAVKFLGKVLNPKVKATEQDRAKGVSDAIETSSAASPVGTVIMRTERALGGAVRYPFGVRCWAICTRQGAAKAA